MTHTTNGLEFDVLRRAYAAGTLSPVDAVNMAYDRIEATRETDGVWIHLEPREGVLAKARALQELSPEARAAMPLYGLPFGVKDCVDVAGVPTTAACPEYAYVPEESNPGVERLVAAGAIFVGKTNLDQFATGLVGARTPYGIARNPFDARYLPGGSSSGAAVSVALGHVSFGLGTDTGGSGRVPASYTATVGLKPSRGLISTRGMTPACRTLDCISVYATSAADALDVLDVAAAPDPTWPYSRANFDVPTKYRALAGDRFAFGVPRESQLEFHGDSVSEAMFEDGIRALEAMGGTRHEVDYAPFLEINDMMFMGPMVAERFAIFGEFLKRNPEAGHPITRMIILNAEEIRAHEAYRMLYRLEELRRQVATLWESFDTLLVPTVGRPFTIAELEAEPLKVNFDHGYYTNFVNPADLAAIAVPNGFGADGLPRGVTFAGPAGTDAWLAELGGRFHDRRGASRPAPVAVPA
ncbi:allophanate hydrolase [Lutibaculum baratangense]|uniref:Allophanate hydrolase n=1 Tax=Lutibaculum baratangense AMV1 TaxID=631454 RepID=V4TFF9_9HYPH|nr:allophanate hydrolase [Lutibaculum baratangense]ESR24873.1 Allophanate hydrolase [Lutibaculum baratangense AMV1]